MFTHTYMYLSLPPWASLLPAPVPSLSVLAKHQAALPGLCAVAPAICLTHGGVCMSMLLSQGVPPSASLAMSTSPFPMPASPLLPCKYVHHFFRLHIGVFSSVQFSCSVMSNSLPPHESQHTRPPCPSPNPGVHSDSCPPSQWCHPAISSSVVPFSSCPQSLPASVFSNESALRMRWPKYWSFSFSIIPSKEIPGLISFTMDWLDLLAVQGTLKSLLQHHSSNHQFFSAQPSSQCVSIW